MKKALLKYYAFLPLILLCGFYAYKAIDFPVHDFANYYFGGKFLAQGNFNADIYFPYKFNRAIFDLGYLGIFASYAPNTPFLAIVFAPFSVFPAVIAKLIFNCLSILLFALSICRLFSFYSINTKFALLIPVLFLVPIKNNLLFGQAYLLLFFLLAEGWIAYRSERWKLTGLLWGCAIMLKIFPVLLLAFLIFKRQWKPFLSLIFSCLLFFGVSLFFTGIDVWDFYLKTVLPKASNGEIANSFVDNYQSVFMFLKRIFIYDKFENPHPALHANHLFYGIVLAFKIGVVAIGFIVSKGRDKAFLPFSFWVVAMILLSPYGSTYVFLLMVFPFMAILQSGISNIKKILLLGILFLINTIPLSVFIAKQFPVSYLRLFFLVAFTVLFIVLLFQKSVLIKAFIISLIVFIPASFKGFPLFVKGESFLPDGSPILIYDYQIKNNQLIYFYWNENGENHASVPFKCLNQRRLKIDKKQIAIGNKLLTNDPGCKLKPILIDDKIVLYLTDYDRGIGFYTIRRINIR